MDLAEIKIENIPHPFFYRKATSDETILAVSFSDNPEYIFPRFDAKNVLDIGANIGVMSVLMANTYPNANVFAFEPDAENFKILIKNAAPYKNIHCFQLGLGARTEQRKLFDSADPENFGGKSLYARGSSDKSNTIQIVQAREFLEDELKLTNLDLIKCDCEGAEFEIFDALTRGDLIRSVKWITGELHGHLEWDLLALLATDFEIGIKKNIGDLVCHFNARNKSLRPK